MTSFAARVAAVALTVGLASHGAVVLAADKVEINADRLQVSRNENLALFEGHVRASFGELRLECAVLQVKYDESGRVRRLEAQGSVRVRRQGVSASSEMAALDVLRGVLVLQGNPRLSSGPHELKGEKITVELETGRMDIERATGTFDLPAVFGVKP